MKGEKQRVLFIEECFNDKREIGTIQKQEPRGSYRCLHNERIVGEQNTAKKNKGENMQNYNTSERFIRKRSMIFEKNLKN